MRAHRRDVALARAERSGGAPLASRPMSERKARLDALATVVLLSCCAVCGLGHVATKTTLTEVPKLMQAASR